ncbi:MAG: trehalose-6-phosphate synthase [bacterium]
MTERRLVVISNRLPSLKQESDWKSGKIPSAGGLVSALLPVMESSSQGLWMGWSGKTTSEAKSGTLSTVDLPIVRVLAMDLSERELNAYYNSFCNRTLWPMFHCFQSRVNENEEDIHWYFEVNKKFSEKLLDFLKPDDMVWVHDYHMVPLGRYLRRGGFKGPLGFFLHIPFPPLEFIEILNDPLGFMDAWLYYDLIGFHTDRYQQNYFEVMERLMLGVKEGDFLFAGRRSQRVIVSPIGIDTRIYDPRLEEQTKPQNELKLENPTPGGQTILSVDRLDYTKGIPERMSAFEHLLKKNPSLRKKISLTQICSPSRTKVKEYREQKDIVDSMVGRINGEFSEHDWTPIRYLYRTYSQQDLAQLYRTSDICLVTPLRDGMNLVAIEYVAAQRPEAPGVLVLSRFTGIAEFFTEAVLVNPYLPDSVAEGLERAYSMSYRERRDRYHAMYEYLTSNTAEAWARNFLEKLQSAHQENRAGYKAITDMPAIGIA